MARRDVYHRPYMDFQNVLVKMFCFRMDQLFKMWIKYSKATQNGPHTLNWTNMDQIPKAYPKWTENNQN